MGLGDILKKASFAACTAAVSPLIAAYKLQKAVADEEDDPYFHYGMLVSVVPGTLGRELRKAFYRNTLKRCGPNLRVGFGSYFVSADTEVGDRVSTGSYTIIGLCTIGDDVLMASHISVLDGLHQHGFEDTNTRMVDQEGRSEKVSIGSNTWIGEGARVAANVGDKSIVGIGAVVTRPIKGGVMVLGNPARVIGHRNKPLTRRTNSHKAVKEPAAAEKPAADKAPKKKDA